MPLRLGVINWYTSPELRSRSKTTWMNNQSQQCRTTTQLRVQSKLCWREFQKIWGHLRDKYVCCTLRCLNEYWLLWNTHICGEKSPPLESENTVTGEHYNNRQKENMPEKSGIKAIDEVVLSHTTILANLGCWRKVERIVWIVSNGNKTYASIRSSQWLVRETYSWCCSSSGFIYYVGGTVCSDVSNKTLSFS
jgi:hypothetical protein